MSRYVGIAILLTVSAPAPAYAQGGAASACTASTKACTEFVPVAISPPLASYRTYPLTVKTSDPRA